LFQVAFNTNDFQNNHKTYLNSSTEKNFLNIDIAISNQYQVDSWHQIFSNIYLLDLDSLELVIATLQY
jgi:hypothetical protein